MALFGPEDFTFEIQKSIDDVVVIHFRTKSSEDSKNAAEDLSDFLWDEDGMFEVDDFKYESDLPVEEVVEQLQDLGFVKC